MFKRTMMLAILWCLLCIFLEATESNRALLVHNTLAEINSVTGKLQLQKVRIWGGEAEEDEHKYFRAPSIVRIDAGGRVYIPDTSNHQVQVFDANGLFIRTIGRKGRGPGDLYGPFSLAFSPEGNIWVHEHSGRRVQCFSPDGKSKSIFRSLDINSIVGITSKEELVVYNHKDCLDSGRLLSFLNEKGKVLRKIGKYDDPCKDILASEKLRFYMDNQDNLYAANRYAPVIRKYKANGQLELVITTEPPFEVPYHITLNPQTNEIDRIGGQKIVVTPAQEKKRKRGYIELPEEPESVFGDFCVDAKARIYILFSKRKPTEKELMATTVISNSRGGINLSQVDYSITDNLEIEKLVVFNSQGKVRAAVDLKGVYTAMYVHEDHLFLVDSLNQQVNEYKMTFLN